MADEESGKYESGSERPEHAEILAPGPILAIAALVVGWGLHLGAPVGGLPSPANYVVGVGVTVGGVAIVYSGILVMRQIDKSPDHEDEPAELLTEGPFAHSRNPLYLGIIVAYLGLTIVIDSVWPVLTLMPLALYFRSMALQEEEYLEATFGEEFREYRDEVRRWL